MDKIQIPPLTGINTSTLYIPDVNIPDQFISDANTFDKPLNVDRIHYFTTISMYTHYPDNNRLSLGQNIAPLTGTNCTCIGGTCDILGSNNVTMGYNINDSGFDNAIVLGVGTTVMGANRLCLGSTTQQLYVNTPATTAPTHVLRIYINEELYYIPMIYTSTISGVNPPIPPFIKEINDKFASKRVNVETSDTTN